MEINTWINGCNVRGFKWIDGKRYYINVQYFQSGSSVERSPVWDKSVYITMNEKGINGIKNFLSSLVNYISRLNIESGKEFTITF